MIAAQSRANPPGQPTFTYQRQYPTGDLFAHVTGYYTFAFGSTGLERTQNDVLDRQHHRAAAAGHAGHPHRRRGQLGHGADDRCAATCSRWPRTPSASARARSSCSTPPPARCWRCGASRATTPTTSSTPDFDRARDVITFLEASPGNPLLANAYQQRYMPGSTFKILTTSIALENGTVDLSTAFPDENAVGPAADERPDRELRGHDVRRRPHRGVHAQLQHPVRQDRPRRSASTRWSRASPTGASASRSRSTCPARRPARSGRPTDLDQNLPLLAIRGFGQNEVQMVPLHMAMVAATVANGGQMMKPYVVEQTLDHDGRVLDRTAAGGVEDADLAGDGRHPDATS